MAAASRSCAGIAVGVEEADRDRLDALRRQPLRDRAHLVRIERRQHVAVAIHALGDFQAVAAGDQRIGKLQEQIVDVVALLRAHLENITEAARGDQSKPGAVSLDQRVGDQRRAMHDVADLGECEPGRMKQVRQPFERADRRVPCAS